MTAGRPEVRGVEVDAETRCAHYHSQLDVIAIKMACCGVYYACKDCHEALAGHAIRVWPRAEWEREAVLCGVCGRELSIRAYMESGYACPSCGAGFNPGCRHHYADYFEWVGEPAHSASSTDSQPSRGEPMSAAEAARAEELLRAQEKAEQLFREVEVRGLVRAGIAESQLNQEIYDLAKEMFGITTYWHKRIVRAGENTLVPYAENPPDHMLQEDDILFLDLGPVFEDYEADFGRTFVLGNDPMKLKMRDDVGKAFAEGKRYFHANPEITASQLYEYAVALALRYGWEFGGPIAGHLIGQFPHEKIAEDKVTLYVHPKSHLRMRSTDSAGQMRHWILEIHFVDRERKIGGFFEELLTV